MSLPPLVTPAAGNRSQELPCGVSEALKMLEGLSQSLSLILCPWQWGRGELCLLCVCGQRR